MRESPPARRPGRPPLDSRAGSVTLSVRVTTPDYALLVKHAEAQHLSVAAYLRRQLSPAHHDPAE